MAEEIFITDLERRAILQEIERIKEAIEGLEKGFQKEAVLLPDIILHVATYILMGPSLAGSLKDILEREVKMHEDAQNITPDKFFRD